MNTNIAVLLTCHNRKSKTLKCLETLFDAEVPLNYTLFIYLVNDGSTDGTKEAVKNKFPNVNIIEGNGSLYWAGGMRLAWNQAIETNNFQAFLLINDDVELKKYFLIDLIETDKYAVAEFGKKGIYSGATIDKNSNEISYGGLKIIRNHFILKTKKVIPSRTPQHCDMTNANILWVSDEVVKQIGIFDDKFIHGIADYDYSLQANKNNFPVLLAPNSGGFCSDDHGNNWKTSIAKYKERLIYLKSPTGLAYKQYLYFIKKNFPLFLPYSFTMLWMKTLFPSLWSNFKKR